MAKILEDYGLSIDDVLLIPRKSTIASRFNGEIDLSVEIVPNLKLKYPLISSNMDTITEKDMANEMASLGGLGIIHRFLKIEDHFNMMIENRMRGRVLCVGVGEEGFDRFMYFWNRNKLGDIEAVLIDIAHGHSNVMLKHIERIKNMAPELPIIAGNTATYEGTYELLMAGVECCKVGVGNGGLCSTRIHTGNGVPQITTLMEARRAVEDYSSSHKPLFKPTIICDGGVKNSGDIIKVLAAGADVVMSGALFAGTKEACGETSKLRTGEVVKCYRGMSSFSCQQNWKGSAKSVEGEETYVPYKGPVKDVFDSLIGGMLSGMSYQDAHNIKELQDNAVFIKQTSAGFMESQPHVLYRK